MNLNIKKCSNRYLLDKNTYEMVINLIEKYLDKLDNNIEEYSEGNGKVGVLLLIGELYPLFNDKDKWADICYDMMVKIREDISNGKIKNYSICDGLSNIALATLIVKESTNYFGKFLDNLDDMILDGVDWLIDEYTKDIIELKVFQYDAILGLSGISAYLLSIKSDKSIAILKKINNYLIKLTDYYSVDGVQVPGWYIKRDNQLTKEYISDFPEGSINYSLSHGIAGCLTILSLSKINGIEIDGQQKAIERILEEYKKVEYINENKIVYWPGMLSFESYKNKDYYSLNDRMSWCYGSIGILRSMYFAALALDNEILKDNIENMVINIAKLDINLYKLEAPIICHGYAGTSSVLRVFYDDIKDDNIRNRCIELINKINNAFNEEYKFGFKDVFYNIEYDNLVRVEKDKNDFLEGSAGIILELIAFIKDNTTFEKLLLIK
ncbi:lanthionine synthetase C family protein [Clostridium perfringens]|nr:lanthionine synthetase C family protein [Clostridium perfringens]